MRKRVWFAEPLLSSATQEVRRLIVLARQWAERFDKPVRVWMSDKQDAFVTAIAAEFAGPPHRYCHNHFLRDVATPMLAMDRHAKVKMRSKVRGLRAMERRVLEARRPPAAPDPTAQHERSKADTTPRADTPAAEALPMAATLEPGASRARGVLRTDSALETTGFTAGGAPAVKDEAGEVVLGSWAVVRGMLHDDQGGPLHPPGGRMREAFQEVFASLDRNLRVQTGGAQRHCGSVLPAVWIAACMSYATP